METIRDYLDAFVALGAEAFIETHYHPFLLYPEMHGHGSFRSYHTQMAERGGSMDLGAPGKSMKDYKVLRPQNAGQVSRNHKFLVGRGEDRDIFIDHSTVSKRHAFLIFDEEGQAYRLGDASSTNGTFLNGQAVESGEPVYLRDSNVVSFGDCDYLFYSPEGMAQILAQLAQAD